jgi:RNA polymerase sigma-70 factor (ECF subfamily)
MELSAFDSDRTAMATLRESHFEPVGWSSVNVARTAEAPDESLVESARGGDRAAFGVLYQRYARMVHGILLGRVPGTSVEDLVQEVFLHVLPRLTTLRDARRFGPWLAAITRNLATDFYRRAKPTTSIEDHRAEVEGLERLGAPFARDDGLVLLNAVRELPECYREPLILRFVEGMTGPEIAARLGLTHGSVRVNLHRGMEMLRQKWGARESHVGKGARP